MLRGLLTKVVGDSDKREVARLQKVVERINALERVADSSSGYTDCYGPSEKEFERLRSFLLKML